MSPRYSVEQKDRIAIYIGLYLNAYASERALEESKKLYNANPSMQEKAVVRTSVDLLIESLDMLKNNVPGSITARVAVGKKISDLEALVTKTLSDLEK